MLHSWLEAYLSTPTPQQHLALQTQMRARAHAHNANIRVRAHIQNHQHTLAPAARPRLYLLLCLCVSGSVERLDFLVQVSARIPVCIFVCKYPCAYIYGSAAQQPGPGLCKCAGVRSCVNSSDHVRSSAGALPVHLPHCAASAVRVVLLPPFTAQMCDIPQPYPAVQDGIYVAGDSHSLSTAWQVPTNERLNPYLKGTRYYSSNERLNPGHQILFLDILDPTALNVRFLQF